MLPRLPLCGALCAGAAAAAAPPQTGNLKPQFSWDTVGGMVFMQVCNPDATEAAPWDDATMRTLAKYPLVCFEKCTGTHTPGYEEDKVEAACAALKAINPRISCIFYLNSELDFSGYRLYDDFAARPDYWLRGPDGNPVQQSGPSWGCRNGKCPDGGLMLPDYSKPAAAAYWYSACANMTKSASIDGCNIDRCSHLGNFTPTPGNSWSPAGGAQAFNDGKLAGLQSLQRELGDGPVICNCHGCLTEATLVPGVYSQNIEGFGPSEGRIDDLRVLAKAGKLAKAHCGPAKGKGCTDPDGLRDGLAAFLTGAGEGAFFSCASGWMGGSWLTWLPEYDKPLGAPLSDAVKGADGVYTRNFSAGTRVRFDTATNRGEICWAGEPCPPPGPIPPTPPGPTPPPPSPPAPVPGCASSVFNGGQGRSASGGKTDLGHNKTESYADCCRACAADPTKACRRWTWYSDGSGQCHRHTADAVPNGSGGRVSGALQ